MVLSQHVTNRKGNSNDLMQRTQTRRRPFYTQCRSVHACGFTAGQKTMENQDWATGPPGHRASGPPGHSGPWAAGRWAIVGHGPQASGPSSRWAAGLSWATGPRACF